MVDEDRFQSKCEQLEVVFFEYEFHADLLVVVEIQGAELHHSFIRRTIIDGNRLININWNLRQKFPAWSLRWSWYFAGLGFSRLLIGSFSLPLRSLNGCRTLCFLLDNWWILNSCQGKSFDGSASFEPEAHLYSCFWSFTNGFSSSFWKIVIGLSEFSGVASESRKNLESIFDSWPGMLSTRLKLSHNWGDYCFLRLNNFSFLAMSYWLWFPVWTFLYICWETSLSFCWAQRYFFLAFPLSESFYLPFHLPLAVS